MMELKDFVFNFANISDNHRSALDYQFSTPYLDNQLFTGRFPNSIVLTADKSFPNIATDPAKYHSLTNNNNDLNNKVFGCYLRDNLGQQKNSYIKMYFPNRNTLTLNEKASKLI